MLYAGIDYHKRYSQVHVIDENGRTRATARLANDGLTVSEFFKSLGEPCAAVLEEGWNWGVMYDWLAATENLKQVELAHPFRVRAIAAAQVKTDAIDAHTLAQLLRSNLIPRAYVPGVETRRLREVVRQRVLLVRVRTMVKSRIHALLDRYHVPAPRGRLLQHEVAAEFFYAVVEQARAMGLLSIEHFTVDGTLIEAWAYLKSFKREDQGSGQPPEDRGNPTVNFHGERRSNATHQSSTDRRPSANDDRRGGVADGAQKRPAPSPLPEAAA